MEIKYREGKVSDYYTIKPMLKDWKKELKSIYTSRALVGSAGSVEAQRELEQLIRTLANEIIDKTLLCVWDDKCIYDDEVEKLRELFK